MYENKLECSSCRKYKELIFSDMTINSLGEHILIKNFPMFICKSCNCKNPSDIAFKFLCFCLDDENIEVLSYKKENECTKCMDYNVIAKKLESKQRFLSSSVIFIYDKKDYLFTPGLQRSNDDAFLTPVYFNIEILLKYIHHPNYGIDIYSDTYGVFYKNDTFSIPFGINDNNHVILWLGDIYSLPEEEQYYLRSENIYSDHSLGSEFYNSQINIQWANPSKEKDLLQKRFDFFAIIRTKYNISMTHLELESIPMAKKIKMMVVDTEDAFRDLILPLNEILIESINVKSIKNYLSNTYPSEKNIFKDYKGIKVLQFWLEKNTANIEVSSEISPLYVLYDFRIIVAHLESSEDKKEKWKRCCERLHLGYDSKYTIVAECLIERLREMYSTFCKAVK